MSKNLNENQLLAVQLVAQGRSGKEIAQELSVTEETVSRWKKQPAFIALVNDLLGQLRDTTQQKMRNLVLLALEILEKELFNESNKNRVNIALKVLNNYKFSTLIDQKIGSENADTIERRQLDKKFAEMF
jgi:transcriptional regulator